LEMLQIDHSYVIPLSIEQKQPHIQRFEYSTNADDPWWVAPLRELCMIRDDTSSATAHSPESRRFIVLYGPQCVGKSVLLLRLLANLEGSGHSGLVVDYTSNANLCCDDNAGRVDFSPGVRELLQALDDPNVGPRCRFVAIDGLDEAIRVA